MHDVGHLLRSARLRSGLTQTQLARRAGVTQPVVSRAEAPGANPTVATLDRLLHAAGSRLELSAPQLQLPDVDEGQILDHLRMTVPERMRYHDAGRASIGAMMADVRVLG